jgi:DNA helicase-2/ATP-dependent DNA helicase PcrA
LTRNNIPFSITSGIRFFEQAHIKDITAYLKLVFNPRDEVSFQRIAQLLAGIGARGAAKLWRAFAAQPSPNDTPHPIATALQRCAAGVPKKTAAPWAQFSATMSQLEAADMRNNPAEMIGLVLEAGYADYLEDNYPNHRTRLEELEQLAVFANQFLSLEEFLSQLALLTNIEAEADRPARGDDDLLRLSTVHQAKGLEFGVVFVIMLCEGLFPSARSLETLEGVEEERRLMYVAVTRARDALYLTYPRYRAAAGGAGNFQQQPSRFLKEIPGALLEEFEPRPWA